MTKLGDLKPLGGVERFESRILPCRLIAQSSQDLTSFSIRVEDAQLQLQGKTTRRTV